MAEAKQEQVYKAKESDFRIEGQYAFTRSSLTLPVGVPFEAVLHPEFWVALSHMFKKNPQSGTPDRTGGIIEVRTEDNAFFGEVYVRAVRGNLLDVACIGPVMENGQPSPVYFGPKDPTVTGYEIRWNIGKRGFDIIRNSDRTIVEDAEKFPTKELAIKWLNEVAGQKTAA